MGIYLGSETGDGDAINLSQPPNYKGPDNAVVGLVAMQKGLDLKADYNWLYQDDDILCAHRTQQQMGFTQMWQVLSQDMDAIMMDTATEAQKMAFAGFVTAVLPCVANFLRADHHTFGKVGVSHAGPLAHALMEVPPSMLYALMTT